jgi:hypothetical protein
MSYSRFLEADVYVFMTPNNYLYCCACWLDERMEQSGFCAFKTQDMVDHLKVHEEAGHRVPSDIYDKLWKDDLENFPVRNS